MLPERARSPVSYFATAERVLPMRAASCSWLSPFAFRAAINLVRIMPLAVARAAWRPWGIRLASLLHRDWQRLHDCVQGSGARFMAKPPPKPWHREGNFSEGRTIQQGGWLTPTGTFAGRKSLKLVYLLI